MSPRRRSRKLPLEWVAKWKAMPTKATQYEDSLDLDLLPDEIAEIWSIDSEVAFDGVATAAVDDESSISVVLSMDPSATNSPITAAGVEDLEVFFNHIFAVNTILDGTAASAQRHTDGSLKVWTAVEGYPILVGTNIGMVSQYDTTADVYTSAAWRIRIFFTRRRATASELNQILLKRR